MTAGIVIRRESRIPAGWVLSRKVPWSQSYGSEYGMFHVAGSRPLSVTVSWSSAVGKFFGLLFVCLFFGGEFNIIINAYKISFTCMKLGFIISRHPIFLLQYS